MTDWERAADGMAAWARGYAQSWARCDLSEAAASALRRTPLHVFAGSADLGVYAQGEVPRGDLPDQQPVSQPVMVAYLADRVGAGPERRILEIGTGSGYQAAVMAEMGADVYSIESRPRVAAVGAERLRAAGYGERVARVVGDGRRGWPERAPFHGVVATARFTEIPWTWIEQLAVGGCLVVPIADPTRQGDSTAALTQTWRRTTTGLALEHQVSCRFVPASGQ